MISFKIGSKSEALLIHQIAKRARDLAGAGNEYPFLDADMDVTAVHVSGCPLKLEELLAADDVNFAHDVFGIRRHLDRRTGKLRDGFSPRYSA